MPSREVSGGVSFFNAALVFFAGALVGWAGVSRLFHYRVDGGVRLFLFERSGGRGGFTNASFRVFAVSLF